MARIYCSISGRLEWQECSVCLLRKPYGDFYKDKTRGFYAEDGTHYPIRKYCSDCAKTKWLSDDPAKVLERRKKYEQKRLKQAELLYGGRYFQYRLSIKVYAHHVVYIYDGYTAQHPEDRRTQHFGAYGHVEMFRALGDDDLADCTSYQELKNIETDDVQYDIMQIITTNKRYIAGDKSMQLKLFGGESFTAQHGFDISMNVIPFNTKAEAMDAERAAYDRMKQALDNDELDGIIYLNKNRPSGSTSE